MLAGVNDSDASWIAAAQPQNIIALLDQLEAERQRAVEMHVGLESEISHSNRCIAKINTLEAELAALKGEQVPVAEIKFSPSTDKHPCVYWFGKQDRDFPVGTQFFTAPQKPVVLPDKIPDALYQLLFDECGGFVECDLNTNKVWQAFKALAAGGIVKDGE